MFADVVGVARSCPIDRSFVLISRRRLKLSDLVIVLGVPYKGCLDSPTPTGEVIMKSAYC
jgi:hypothetical protein